MKAIRLKINQLQIMSMEAISSIIRILVPPFEFLSYVCIHIRHVHIHIGIHMWVSMEFEFVFVSSFYPDRDID